uniref:Uncharacterized protein n=1 Tax=Romanomermis culicivorax TaxID=13658 RepID=A0A915JEX7_ROMCU
STKFAKKFCSHRWVENVIVVERALEILPYFRQYVTSVEPKPTVTSFDTLEQAFKDIFLESKMEFFKTMALHLEPFLRKFQTPLPMSPFIFDEISSLHGALLRRILKSSIVDEAMTNNRLLELPKILFSNFDQAFKKKPIKFPAYSCIICTETIRN